MENGNYFVHSAISTVISIERESVSISHEKEVNRVLVQFRMEFSVTISQDFHENL